MQIIDQKIILIQVPTSTALKNTGFYSWIRKDASVIIGAHQEEDLISRLTKNCRDLGTMNTFLSLASNHQPGKSDK